MEEEAAEEEGAPGAAEEEGAAEATGAREDVEAVEEAVMAAAGLLRRFAVTMSPIVMIPRADSTVH